MHHGPRIKSADLIHGLRPIVDGVRRPWPILGLKLVEAERAQVGIVQDGEEE
jgi:hypothetical protein